MTGLSGTKSTEGVQITHNITLTKFQTHLPELRSCEAYGTAAIASVAQDFETGMMHAPFPELQYPLCMCVIELPVLWASKAPVWAGLTGDTSLTGATGLEGPTSFTGASGFSGGDGLTGGSNAIGEPANKPAAIIKNAAH